MAYKSRREGSYLCKTFCGMKPFVMVESLRPKCLASGLPSNTVVLGIKLSTYKFGWEPDIQTTARGE